MSAATFPKLRIFLILAALLALAACSSKTTTICPLAANCPCLPSGLCVAPHYVFAAGNGQVLSFPIQSNGALGTSTSTSGPTPTFGMAALNNSYLYMGNPVPEIGGEVDAWAINLSNGSLTTVPGSPFLLGAFTVAGGVAANPATQVVYVADSGKVDALQADATGALKPINGSPFTAGTNLYLTLDPQNRFLFTSVDDPPGGVFAFTMDSTTGALTAVPGSPFLPIPNYPGNTQPAQIVVDASSNFVYTPLTTTGQVAAFSINAPAGTLTAVPGSPFTAGNRPVAVATINNFLYVSNTQDGTISGYSINATNGVLTPLSGSPFAIPAAVMLANPFSNVLYVSGAAGISAYSIDSQSGALTLIAGSPFPATGVTAMAFVP